MNGKEAVVLFSSGVDSLASLQWAREKYEKVYPLYVDLNTKYAKKEVEAFKEICDELKIEWFIDSATLNLQRFEEEDAYVPFRNLYLVLQAFAFGVSKRISNFDIVIQNVQIGETSIEDRTLDFNKKLEEVLKLKQDVKIVSPFADFTKSEIVKWLLKRTNEKVIKMTIGCFSPNAKNCGRCSACFRRWIAFENNNIKEDFSKDILSWEGIDEYSKKIKNGKYDERRVEDTKRVLEKYGRW